MQLVTIIIIIIIITIIIIVITSVVCLLVASRNNVIAHIMFILSPHSLPLTSSSNLSRTLSSLHCLKIYCVMAICTMQCDYRYHHHKVFF